MLALVVDFPEAAGGGAAEGSEPVIPASRFAAAALLTC